MIDSRQRGAQWACPITWQRRRQTLPCRKKIFPQALGRAAASDRVTLDARAHQQCSGITLSTITNPPLSVRRCYAFTDLQRLYRKELTTGGVTQRSLTSASLVNTREREHYKPYICRIIYEFSHGYYIYSNHEFSDNESLINGTWAHEEP